MIELQNIINEYNTYKDKKDHRHPDGYYRYPFYDDQDDEIDLKIMNDDKLR